MPVQQTTKSATRETAKRAGHKIAQGLAAVEVGVHQNRVEIKVVKASRDFGGATEKHGVLRSAAFRSDGLMSH